MLFHSNYIASKLICVAVFIFIFIIQKGNSNLNSDPSLDPLLLRYGKKGLYLDNGNDICKRFWSYAIDKFPYDINDTIKTDYLFTGNAINKNVLLVHIGKTCGRTVAFNLRDLKVEYAQLHVYPLRQSIIDAYEYIFITLRDPVERTISAFNFDNPNNPGSFYYNNTNYCPDSIKEFYSCFQNIDAYANSLLNEDKCGSYSREIQEGITTIKNEYPQGKGGVHLPLNTCFYIGGVMKALKRHKNVFVIRTEHCNVDLQEIFDHLKWDKTINTNTIIKRRLYPENKKNLLNLSSVLALRGYLELIGEYNLYRELLHHQSNQLNS
jgi:hypothetical protein